MPVHSLSGNSPEEVDPYEVLSVAQEPEPKKSKYTPEMHDRAIKVISKYEGFSSTGYVLKGEKHPTIARGHYLDGSERSRRIWADTFPGKPYDKVLKAVWNNIKLKKGGLAQETLITEEQGDALLSNDQFARVKEIEEYFPEIYNKQITADERDLMFSLWYQGSFSGSKLARRKIKAALKGEKGQWEAAALEFLQRKDFAVEKGKESKAMTGTDNRYKEFARMLFNKEPKASRKTRLDKFLDQPNARPILIDTNKYEWPRDIKIKDSTGATSLLPFAIGGLTHKEAVDYAHDMHKAFSRKVKDYTLLMDESNLIDPASGLLKNASGKEYKVIMMGEEHFNKRPTFLLHELSELVVPGRSIVTQSMMHHNSLEVLLRESELVRHLFKGDKPAKLEAFLMSSIRTYSGEKEILRELFTSLDSSQEFIFGQTKLNLRKLTEISAVLDRNLDTVFRMSPDFRKYMEETLTKDRSSSKSKAILRQLGITNMSLTESNLNTLLHREALDTTIGRVIPFRTEFLQEQEALVKAATFGVDERYYARPGHRAKTAANISRTLKGLYSIVGGAPGVALEAVMAFGPGGMLDPRRNKVRDEMDDVLEKQTLISEMGLFEEPKPGQRHEMRADDFGTGKRLYDEAVRLKQLKGQVPSRSLLEAQRAYNKEQ